MAASEFGVDRRVVASHLRTAGIVAGPDGKYSTRDIAAAIFGDIKFEKLRKVREDADYRMLQNQARRGQIIETRLAARAWEAIIMTAKTRILGLGAKIESQYVDGMPQGDLRKLIELEVRQLLEDLSKPIEYTSLIDADSVGEQDDEPVDPAATAED